MKLKIKKFLLENAADIEMCASGSLAILGGATLCLFAPEIAAVTSKLQEMNKAGASKAEMAKVAVSGYTKYAGLGFACTIASIILAAKSKQTVENQLKEVTAVLASQAASFAAYRQRVVDDQGKDKDFEYYTGQKVVTRRETQNDGTVIETKVIMPDEELKDGKKVIPHSFVFDEGHNDFTDSNDANINFLFESLAAANRKLSHDGYIFENDIRKAFGAPLVKGGQSAGALRDWPDGTVEHKIRLNPLFMQGLLNGTQNWCVCAIEYDDGTPLNGCILDFADEIGLKEDGTIVDKDNE